MQLTLVVLAFALMHFASANLGHYGQQRNQQPYASPPVVPVVPVVPAVPKYTKTEQVVKNVNTVLLPAVPSVVSCTKTYSLKCTSQATITYLNTNNNNQTQSCNNFTSNSDFVNSIDLGVDLTIFQEIVTAITDLVVDLELNGTADAPVNAHGRRKRGAASLAMGQLISNSSGQPQYVNLAQQVANFFSSQLGTSRCQACCEAFASLNSGIDPKSGLGTAVSKWTPTSGANGTNSLAAMQGTCSCCYTKQVETCIRVQDPNYNPDKYKKVPWKFFKSQSNSSSSSDSSESSKSSNSSDSSNSSKSKNETSSASSSVDEDDEESYSSSGSSNSGYKKSKNYHKRHARAVPVALPAKIIAT